MELEEVRTLDRSFPRIGLSYREERGGGEAQLRGEYAEDYLTLVAPVVDMMEFHQQQQKAASPYDSSSYRRPFRQELEMGHYQQQHRPLFSDSSHLLARSRSASSLSDASCGSDSDTAMTMKSSMKSSPSGSDSSMSNYYSRMDCGKGLSTRTVSFALNEAEMQGDDRLQEPFLGSELIHSSSSFSPSEKELREVFQWVDENNDGLICGADLRGFMSRVLAFEMSEDEAETLLLFYSNGRTLHNPGQSSSSGPAAGGRRRGGGAVVDFEGFFSLYECLCGEQASPEEQSMMATASRVFDETQLQSGRWI